MNVRHRYLGCFFLIASLMISAGITHLKAADFQGVSPGKDCAGYG